jgi:uncharacterized protein YgbK (DUF1537 family)
VKKWKFVSLLQGDKPVVADDFAGAWKAMEAWVRKQLETTQLSYQVLETTIWLENPAGIPIFFYDARDRACRENLIAQ